MSRRMIALPFFKRFFACGSECSAMSPLHKLRHDFRHESIERAAGIVLAESAPSEREDRVITTALLEETSNFVTYLLCTSYNCHIKFASDG